MADWIPALLAVGFGTGGAAILRELLICRVVVWSLTADDRGREHAIKLLRVLKPFFRRSVEPPDKSAKSEPPNESSDPQGSQSQ